MISPQHIGGIKGGKKCELTNSGCSLSPELVETLYTQTVLSNPQGLIRFFSIQKDNYCSRCHLRLPLDFVA